MCTDRKQTSAVSKCEVQKKQFGMPPPYPSTLRHWVPAGTRDGRGRGS